MNGFVGGVQAGVNYQFDNNVVVGAEADFQWSGVDGSYTVDDEKSSVDIKVKWFNIYCGRLGYALDRTLIYGTAGVVISKMDFNSTYQEAFSFTGSNKHVGWTAGLGVEHALTDNWTVKAEYSYLDFGSADYVLRNVEGALSPTYAKGSGSGSFLRLGVNYKF